MKKKILFLAPGLVVGGAEKFLVSLMNRLDKEQFDIVLAVLSDNNPLLNQVESGIPVKVYSRKSKFDVSPIFELRSLLKEIKPDIVFCLGLFPFFFLQLASFLIGSTFRKLISYHSTVYHTKKDDRLARMYFKMIDKYTHVIPVSENQREYTIDRFGVPSNIFTTIHNGVDVDFWTNCPSQTIREETRLKYDIPLDAKVVVQTAAFRPEKNHVAALKALHVINTKENAEKLYLLLVGDGQCRKLIEDTIDELKLQPYVRLAGIQRDVRPFYWCADFFSLTSYSIETFSIAALEAMSTGLPCALTDIGGANEMIVSGKNGLLCSPDYESIAKVWEQMMNTSYNPIDIRSYIQSRFSEKGMVDAYTRFFKS